MTKTVAYMGDGWFIRHDPDGGDMDLYLGNPTDPDPPWYCGISPAGWMYGDADRTWPVEKAGGLATALTCLAQAWAYGPAEHRRGDADRRAAGGARGGGRMTSRRAYALGFATAAAISLGLRVAQAHTAPPPACSILNVDTPRLARGEVWSTVDIYCRRGVQVLAVDAALQRSDHRSAIYGAPFMDYGRTRPGVLHPHAYTPCGTRRRGYRWRVVVTLVYGERTSRSAKVVVRRSAWTPRLIWCSGDVTVRR